MLTHANPRMLLVEAGCCFKGSLWFWILLGQSENSFCFPLIICGQKGLGLYFTFLLLLPVHRQQMKDSPLKWLFKMLRFLIHFFPARYVVFSQTGAVKYFNPIGLGQEKFLQRLERWTGVRFISPVQAHNYKFLNFMPSHISPGWDPSHLGHFGLFPYLRMLPFTQPGPKQRLPAICFHPNTGGNPFLEIGLLTGWGRKRYTHHLSRELWYLLRCPFHAVCCLFIAILVSRTARFSSWISFWEEDSLLSESVSRPFRVLCSFRFVILTSFQHLILSWSPLVRLRWEDFSTRSRAWDSEINSYT